MTGPDSRERLITALNHWNRHAAQWTERCANGHGSMIAGDGHEGPVWRCGMCPAWRPTSADQQVTALGFAELGPAALPAAAPPPHPTPAVPAGTVGGRPGGTVKVSAVSQALVRRTQSGKRPLSVAGVFTVAGAIVGLLLGVIVGGFSGSAGGGGITGLLLGAVAGAVYGLLILPRSVGVVSSRLITPARFLPVGGWVSATASFTGPNLARVVYVGGADINHPQAMGGVLVTLSNGQQIPAEALRPVSVRVDPAALAGPDRPAQLSSRHRRWIRLWFTSVHALAVSRRGSRWVDRCAPTTRHARRSDTPNRSRRWPTALRRRSGVRSFPRPAP